MDRRAEQPANMSAAYGQDDTDSLCPSLPPDLADILRMPGAYHLGGGGMWM
jgi:type IV secretory pathway VirJ component